MIEIKFIAVAHHDFDLDVVYGLGVDNKMYKWDATRWIGCENSGKILRTEQDKNDYKEA